MPSGKAIIVGATSGIGRELAILLSETGFTVGITGRRFDLLQDMKRLYPKNIFVSNFDVTQVSEVSGRLSELALQLGGLDLLIISSGIGELNPILDFEIEEHTIAVNVTGFTAIADWAFKYFEKQGGGHLAGITSIAGLRGGRFAPAYYATKAYQINYLEGLRQKVNQSKKPIFITDIRPGFVDTAMAKGEGKFWVAPATKAAKQILSAINRKRKVVYVTKRWQIFAALLKILPRILHQNL